MSTVSHRVRITAVVAAFALQLVSAPTSAQDRSQATHHEHVHAGNEQPTISGDGYQVTQSTYAIPAVDVVDEHGRTAALSSVLQRDEPMFLDFVFTTCTVVCPILTQTLSRVRDQLGSEAGQVNFVSISIDPEQDTPATLLAYTQKHDTGPRWHFYTGELADLTRVQSAFDVLRGAKMNHEPVIFVRSNASQPWTRLAGAMSATDVLREYRKLRSPAP